MQKLLDTSHDTNVRKDLADMCEARIDVYVHQKERKAWRHYGMRRKLDQMRFQL